MKFQTSPTGHSVYQCEFCLKYNVQTKHHTVCVSCDTQMEEEQRGFEFRRAAEWAMTHACKTCKAPLTEDRHSQCHKCMPEHSRETAWEYDDMPDTDISTNEVLVALKARPTDGTKMCGGKNGCKTEKPLSEFFPNPQSPTGRRTNCRTCMAEANRKRRQRRSVLKGVKNEMPSLR